MLSQNYFTLGIHCCHNNMPLKKEISLLVLKYEVIKEPMMIFESKDDPM